MNTKLWEPKDTQNTAIAQLQRDLGFTSYGQLHKWSIDNPALFWSRAWDDCQIIGHKGSNYYSPGKDFISAKFFSDATLNVAENLLAKGGDASIAIISLLEDGSRSEITWAQLRSQVAATTAAMKAAGVVRGDRVVAWVPNVSETIIYALGALSIGAIVSTASPTLRQRPCKTDLVRSELRFCWPQTHINTMERHLTADRKLPRFNLCYRLLQPRFESVISNPGSLHI